MSLTGDSEVLRIARPSSMIVRKVGEISEGMWYHANDMGPHACGSVIGLRLGLGSTAKVNISGNTSDAPSKTEASRCSNE